jgi:hypothetical protein
LARPIRSEPAEISVTRARTSPRAMRLENTTTLTLDVRGEEDFTLSYWFNISPPNVGTLLGQTGMPRVAVLENGYVQIAAGTVPEGSPSVKIIEKAVSDGLWHHFAVAQSTNSLFVVIDSEVVSFPASSRLFGNLPFQGYRDKILQYSGSIDELQLWAGAMEIPTLLRNAHKTLSGNEPGLITYVNFEYRDPAGMVLPLNSGPFYFGEIGLTTLMPSIISDAPIYDFDLRPSRMAAGMGLRLLSGAGQQFVLQSSVDLKLWIAVETNVLDSTETYSWTLPFDTKSSQIFYRVVEDAGP